MIFKYYFIDILQLMRPDAIYL